MPQCYSVKFLKHYVNYVILIMYFAVIPSRTATRVSLYEHYNKEGAVLRINNIKNCMRLPSRWQESVSSVDSHGSPCLALFENEDCTGKYIRLRSETATYVPNLKRIRFNDVASSIKPCQATSTGTVVLTPGRYAIQNSDDRKFLTARHLLKGYTAVETERWRQKISQQWDVTRNRDGSYWLIPRVHFSRNPLTYDLRKYAKDSFPEIGMFKEREYWVLKNVKKNVFMIKNDDTRKCLVIEDNSLIEQDKCDKSSENQHWVFHRLTD